MDLEHVLATCRVFERRAGAVYRRFADRCRGDAELSRLWSALAEDEDRHAARLERLDGWLDRAAGWHTSLDGWDEAIAEIEARLADAERPDVGGDVDAQLAAALALERTELDVLSDTLVRVLRRTAPGADASTHVGRLLDVAARRGTTPTVQLERALLAARTKLAS
jgi:rubrerythrin